MNRLTIIFLLLAAVRGNLHADTPDMAPSDTITEVKPALPAHTAPRPSSTPVDIDDDKPVVVLHYYDKHGNPLDEPVRFLATLDTVKTVKPGPTYPLYNGINIGVNFGDLVLMAFGQRYGSFDAWANVSLHNWVFPTLEVGVGYANETPARLNYTYHVSPSVYAKIGANYNFIYKSNPDYQFFLGARVGFSAFSYSLRDVTVSSDFWNETQHTSINGLRSTAVYGELLAGLQVKIVGPFSLGWSARWHFLFHASRDRESRPSFIPGYGGTGPFAISLSAIWTFGRKPARAQEEITTSE
ncbi:MAG: hypothetical protein K2N88_02770 [Muribaculaceae bacterium]|nr:hypothetical protein [Muribaculaceae bacterium]